MSNLIQIANNIRNLRTAFGETQEQLANVLHVEKNTVSNYETGKREPKKILLMR